MNEQNNPTVIQHKSSLPVWLPLLGAGVILAGGGLFYENSQTSALQKEIAQAKQDNAALQSRIATSDSVVGKTLDNLRAELDQTKQETGANVAKAQSAAARHADVVVSRYSKQQAAQSQQFTEELGKVKESTLEASTKIAGVSSEVGSVKTEVQTAKSDIESAKIDINDTRTELQRSRGDMGVMSGLIATNSGEIQQLRELGDRNIIEFTVDKNSGLTKVGDIQLALRKSDVKRNRFSLDVLADDKRVEKKDKTINEPVQFYTSKARQPYEIVVNTVTKNKVTGYLATPKVILSRVQ